MLFHIFLESSYDLAYRYTFDDYGAAFGLCMLTAITAKSEKTA